MSDNLHELSDKELKWGYWWVLHRVAIRHAVEVVLGLVALILCGFSLWQLTDWLTNRRAEEEAITQIVNREINFAAYHQSNAPIPLVIGTVTAVPTARGLYDLVAEVKNPNFKWAINELPFVFTADNQTVRGNTFFLPLEEKYLVKLGVALKHKPKQISLTFDKFNWQKVRNLGELPIPTFDISDEVIEQLTPQDAGMPIGTSLKFTLSNTSPYSYWQIGLTVILTKTGSIQGVGQQVISDVKSQSARTVEFFWPGTVITADNMIVRPEVNVLDPRVLK